MFAKRILLALVILIIAASASPVVPCWSQAPSVEASGPGANKAGSSDTGSSRSGSGLGGASNAASRNLPPDNSEDSAGSAEANSAVRGDDEETMFYAFLKEDPNLETGPMYNFLRNNPGVREFVAPHTRLERKFRPMLQWRRWANKHQRFFPSLLFICLISVLSWAVFPSLLQASAEECRTSFWKSFGTGILAATIAMTTLRGVFLTEIGWPLGILMAGVAQALMLIGLSVAIYILGHSLALLLQVKRINALASRPGWYRFTELFIGSVFAASLLQIPGMGAVPPCGTRLLTLFAILGTGALYRELLKRKRAAQ